MSSAALFPYVGQHHARGSLSITRVTFDGRTYEAMTTVRVRMFTLLISTELPAAKIVATVRKLCRGTARRLLKRPNRLIFPAARYGEAAQDTSTLATATHGNGIIFWPDWNNTLIQTVFDHELAHHAIDSFRYGPPFMMRDRWVTAAEADAAHGQTSVSDRTRVVLSEEGVRWGGRSVFLTPGRPWTCKYASEQPTHDLQLAEDWAESLTWHLRCERGEWVSVDNGPPMRFSDLFPNRAELLNAWLTAPQPRRYKVCVRERAVSFGRYHLHRIAPHSLLADQGTWRLHNRHNETAKFFGPPAGDPMTQMPPCWPQQA
jgi:hypothetical protein